MAERRPVNPHYVVGIRLSEPLAQETREVVRLLREAPDEPATRNRAVELLWEAAEANLDFYFLIPAHQLKVGSWAIRLLNMGTRTVLRLITSVGHRIVARLSAAQLRYVADFVEEQLLADNAAGDRPAS